MDEVLEEKPKRVKTGGAKKGSKYNKLPPMLFDLRWAYRYADRVDKKGTKQQERFRQAFRDKPAEFVALLQRTEREYQAVKSVTPKPTDAVPPAPVVEVEPDVGTDKALELVRRWLGERRPAAQPRQE